MPLGNVKLVEGAFTEKQDDMASRLTGMKVANEKLVRALYAEHAGPLLRFASRLMSGDRRRAEDIVQETLLRAWLHPDALADRPARPWLFAVARNLAVDWFRAGKARPPEVGDKWVRFVQTAGGRTGLPAPRRVRHPPFVQWRAPLAWTTLHSSGSPSRSQR